MEISQSYLYDKACYQMYKTNGIRFSAIINKRGRKIAGGFNSKVSPLETDEKKIEMLFMEMALDLSMRNEFNDSLGVMRAIISFRDKTNIITIPHRDNFMLVSSEPELDPNKVIEIAHSNLPANEIVEVMIH